MGSARWLRIEKFSKPDSLFTQGRQCKQIRRLSLSAKKKVSGVPEPSSAGPGPLEHGLPDLKCFVGAEARQNDGLAAAAAAGDKLCTKRSQRTGGRDGKEKGLISPHWKTPRES